MSLFGNDAINRVTLHSTIQALAQGAGGLFVFVFLLRAGVATPLVLCSIAAMSAGRFVLRGRVLDVARRFGLRVTLIIGSVLEALIFPLLPLVHGPGLMLGVVIVVGAVGSVLYWTSFHAYFAAQGDAAQRGRQVALREALTALVGIVAPGVGGWALVVLGPWTAFSLIAVIQALAAAPLIGAPDIRIAASPLTDRRAVRLAVMLQATDGWFAAVFVYLWQIGLFVTLGEHFASYGGAMALAGGFGAVASFAIGHLVDLGHGGRSVLIVYGAAAAVVVLKALAFGHPAAAVIANAASAVVLVLLSPVMMTQIYNMAQRSACTLRFHMATEGGWDVGCISGCLAAAGLIALGAPMAAPMLLGLPAVAIGGALLVASYPANAAANRA